MKKVWIGVLLVLAGLGVLLASGGAAKAPAARALDPGLAQATFAGGCFWCVEAGFEAVPGVVEVVSGYTGGHTEDPSYREVSSGGTGHLESVRVYYDPERIRYEGLLAAFWRMVDPTDAGGQFVDRGEQYATAIFYHDEAQRAAAEGSKAALAASGRYRTPVVTPIRPVGRFYEAEDYHQDYYRHNPIRYKFYRYHSGRDQYLEKIWGEDLHLDYAAYRPAGGRYGRPPDGELRARLTPMQYRVTQEEGTEPPFQNAYWDEKRDGIYVDVVSGEPLFSSRDKFASGTGWPSFTRPIEAGAVLERSDHRLLLPRTELRSRFGDSHLGHVFQDGPQPTGLRYCINSAALRFVASEDLEKAGYADFRRLFE